MNTSATNTASEFNLARAHAIAVALVTTVIGGLLLASLVASGIAVEMINQLDGWSELDTWIAATGALVAMACALPGNFLVLRKQSMMGDALSHTVLPGIMIAFLAAHAVFSAGWIDYGTYVATRHLVMLLGAVLIGILCAVLTEWVQRLGNVEGSAALGVVFTTLFAIGLLLIRLAADRVHLDPNCVFYGTIETIIFETYGATGVPVATIVNGAMLLVNILLLLLFYKELKISAFDDRLASTLGIAAPVMLYGLMAVTAATLVAAFESVGSILVIAMLIVPPATASLLTTRLSRMIALSLLFGLASAVCGHVLAITLPAVVFSRLGYPSVTDASTAGMMATTSGGFFLLAMLFAPRQGLSSKALDQLRLRVELAASEILGMLYRVDEGKISLPAEQALALLYRQGTSTAATYRLAYWVLRSSGRLVKRNHTPQLTPAGEADALRLVRSHRLWESYLAKHTELPPDHLHAAAQRVTPYLDTALAHDLESELEHPPTDPHGSRIPRG